MVVALIRRTLVLACLSLVAATSARAEVDLQLVLAVDASGSVNTARFELQKRGYAAAFRDKRVQQAIAGGASQSIAVTMLQWTGPQLQVQVVPWSEVHDAASAEALADLIAAAPRRLFGGGTSISGAIDRAMRVFPPDPPQGMRRVIDISGDGANNSGRQSADARDDAVEQGVVINGLPILNIEPDLDLFYRTQVIGGPGSFLIAIDNYDQFAEAIIRKLVTEIASLPAETASERHANAIVCDKCGENGPVMASTRVMDLAGRVKTTYTP
jgi:hypothetical protein